MKIKLKKTFDNEVLNAWTKIEKNENLLIFQTSAWNHHWIKYNKISNNLRILIVYIKNEPALIFPFFVKKKYFFKFIYWIGYDLSDYLSPIVNRQIDINLNTFNSIWEEIIKILELEADVIFLKKQIEDGAYSLNPIIKYLNCKDYDLTFGINFNKSGSIVDRKGKTIQKIKWSKKKLSGYGKLEFESDIKVKNRISILNKILTWKKKKINEDKNIFQKYNENFFKEIIDNKYFTLSGLKLNNNYVSLSINIYNNRSIIYYIPSYTNDKRLLKFSPGKIHMYDLIKDKYKSGCKYFDFGNGNEKYKLNWSNEKKKIYYYLKSLTSLGKIFTIILSIKNEF